MSTGFFTMCLSLAKIQPVLNITRCNPVKKQLKPGNPGFMNV